MPKEAPKDGIRAGERTQPTPPGRTLKEFLELFPPDTPVTVASMVALEMRPPGQQALWYLDLPTIELFCESAECNGRRLFSPRNRNYLDQRNLSEDLIFVTYVCNNCHTTIVHYALAYSQEFLPRTGLKAALPYPADREAAPCGEIMKLGQLPALGPPTPSRLLSLVGPERNHFFQGRRAESLGLGIGAFAYYRRVVDNQWQRILDQIIAVAKKIGADADMIADLESARTETQFTKAVERVKHGIPHSLYVSGQNPLTLLYQALSNEMHDGTDAECLELASSIRLVLTELSERLGEALAVKKDLDNAVKKLAAHMAQRAKKAQLDPSQSLPDAGS